MLWLCDLPAITHWCIAQWTDSFAADFSPTINVVSIVDWW